MTTSTIDRIIEAIHQENDLQQVAKFVSLSVDSLKHLLIKALMAQSDRKQTTDFGWDNVPNVTPNKELSNDSTSSEPSDSSELSECSQSSDDAIDRLIDQITKRPLSSKQREFIRLAAGKRENLALLCPAGYGKTTVIRSLVAVLRRPHDPRPVAWFQKRYGNACNVEQLRRCPIVGLCASTGKAASLIRGRTLHSFLGIGMGRGSVDEWFTRVTTAKFMRGTFDMLRAMQVLIVDEISMISAQLLDKISEYLQRVRKSDEPFGGVQIIFVGDMCQLAPVKGAFMFQSREYKAANVRTFRLTKCFRQTDATFLSILDEIRFGKCSARSLKVLQSRTKIEDAYSEGMRPMKLMSTNHEVDVVNERELIRTCEETGAEIVVFKVRPVNGRTLSRKADMYRNLEGIPTEARLAAGCQVVITHNLGGNVVNGSQGRVIAVSSSGVQVELLGGLKVSVGFIGYKDPEYTDVYKAPTLFSYLPIRLGYASTIHKAQGMTLRLLEVDLKKVFAHGQAYVAISRCVDLQGLIVYGLADNSAFICDSRVKEFYGVSTPAALR